MDARTISPPTRTYLTAALLALLLLPPSPGGAQEGGFRISQRATVAQRLGSALISLDYSRPLARGRSELFGKVVHWGEIWTPGANEATVLELSEAAKLGGRDVPAGRWSMWIIPSRVGPWELMLDPRDSLFHTQRPEPADDQVRFEVEARHDASPAEVLTWSFPRVAHDGATVEMSWGPTRVQFDVEVPSSRPALTVAADTAALYVGEWRLTFSPPPGGEGSGEALPPTVLTIRHGEDGTLTGSFPPDAFGPPPGGPVADTASEAGLSARERERAAARRALAEAGPGLTSYLLVPRAPGIFLLGYTEAGELLEVIEFFHEFEFENGRAVRLTLRDDEDHVMGRGVRVEN